MPIASVLMMKPSDSEWPSIGRMPTRSSATPRMPSSTPVPMMVTRSGICHSTSSVNASSEPTATHWPWAKFTVRLTMNVRLKPTAISANRLPTARPLSVAWNMRLPTTGRVAGRIGTGRRRTMMGRLGAPANDGA